MKDKKVNIKFIISLFIVLFGIVFLITGTSYALLKGNFNDTNVQLIKTGSVELELTESFEDISKKILLSDDASGLLKDDVYSFSIKNVGNAPARYELKLVNDVPSDYEGDLLDTKYIKVGLEINGEENGPMSLEKVQNIIDSNIIYENEIINYKLRIWLNNGYEEEISNIENYKAFLKLKVEAVQRK